MRFLFAAVLILMAPVVIFAQTTRPTIDFTVEIPKSTDDLLGISDPYASWKVARFPIIDIIAMVPGVWFAGNGAPSDGVGKNGDFYMNLTTPEWYGPKAANTWTGTGPNSLAAQSGEGILRLTDCSAVDEGLICIDIDGTDGTVGKVSVHTGGTGYGMGDVLTLSGGDATVVVTGVNSGVITAVEVGASTGSGYLLADYSVIGGSGTGARINVTAFGDFGSLWFNDQGEVIAAPIQHLKNTTSNIETRISTIETNINLKTNLSGRVVGFTLSDQESKLVDFVNLTAGHTITKGAPVYGKWDSGIAEFCAFMYSATAADAANYFLLGIADESAAAEAPVQVWVGGALLMRRDAFSFSTATLGKPLWTRNTAGAVSSVYPPETTTRVNKVGTAVSANHILYRFSIDDTYKQPE